jgi:hypothetical protein
MELKERKKPSEDIRLPKCKNKGLNTIKANSIIWTTLLGL